MYAPCIAGTARGKCKREWNNNEDIAGLLMTGRIALEGWMPVEALYAHSVCVCTMYPEKSPMTDHTSHPGQCQSP